MCVCVCAIVFNQWLKTAPTRAASIWRFTARVGASPVKVPEVSRCGMFYIVPLVERFLPFIDSKCKLESWKGSSLTPKGL